ncbi:hypothetical protein DPMN_021576 [Dreissena polymorpha]|uniref:C2H2-type domain-containing protein n=1 Tax=Dreissena polymorpha TaxID=45954 RepID=A0A9D4SB48_DREPO|nr:hypothetical protein DPMN_021576 [Dreissena polymorpha]
MDAEEQAVIDTALAEEPLNDDGRFTCGICDRSYSRKDALNRHLKIHNSSQHSCKKCYTFFPSVVALIEHQHKSHQKKILCSFCGKGFERTSHLKEHTIALHGERKLSCSFAGCSKTFYRDEIYQESVRNLL